MKISNTEDGTITVNGLTFLQFMNAFRGKYILNSNGNRVHKYLLYWSGVSIERIKEKFTLVDRK